MGHRLAVLLHHELASIVDEDIETLSDRLKVREAELEARGAHAYLNHGPHPHQHARDGLGYPLYLAFRP